MEQIKVGSVVRLKSGGPDMVVDNIGERNTGRLFAKCIWFTLTEPKEYAFLLATLELVGP